MKPFIVIEGIDRSGKSTVAKFLSEYFNFKIIEFPNRSTPIGNLIDQYLNKKIKFNKETIHLLFSANRYEFKEYLENRNCGIIAVRYDISGISYSLTKGLNNEWIEWPDKLLPIPNAYIYIDVDGKSVMEREGFGDEVYEKVEFLNIANENMKNLIYKKENFFIVDGKKSKNEIFLAIKDYLIELFNANQ